MLLPRADFFPNFSQPTMELSVFCSNILVIDRLIWHSFLFGLSVQQTVTRVKEEKSDLTMAQVSAVVTTQYRNYELLESFLHQPKTLQTQLLFHLSKKTRETIVKSYYQLDDKVVRELLGKRLNHRLRKDLDYISQRTRTSMAGCKRMFDNMKRIYKILEDMEVAGNPVTYLTHKVHLPPDLAQEYAYIIFINGYRLDTTKRKLVQVQLSDFMYSNKC